MIRSKRVSFNKEVTIKEFIKKNGNSSVDSDGNSPDLYRAPINHMGGADDEVMDETCADLVSSDMELTETIINPSTAPQLSGELTTMFSRPDSTRHITKSDEFSKDTVASEERLLRYKDRDLDTTIKHNDIESLAKVVLSSNTSQLQDSAMEISSLNESESSSVRRSARLARLSNDSMGTPEFRTPQIKLKQGRKRGISSSVSKQKKSTPSITEAPNSNESDALLIASSDKMHRDNFQELSGLSMQASNEKLTAEFCANFGGKPSGKSSSIKEKRAVSLRSTFNGNETNNISSVSRLASMDLLDNSGESSNLSSLPNDSRIVRLEEEKRKRNQKLHETLSQKRENLKNLKLKLKKEQERTKTLWVKYETTIECNPHPFNWEVLEALKGGYPKEQRV